jgi:type II secretory pathway component GspD/PulD (secretin)
MGLSLQWSTRLFFSGCLMACAVLAQSLEVIELKHRRAEEVIPILQPLLERDGALSGRDYSLFIRASAANVAQLRQALVQLDRQAHQLRVSVRHSSLQEMQAAQGGISGTVGSSGARIVVHGTDSTASDNGTSNSNVLVLDGGSAFIATGQSVPMVTAVIAGQGRDRFVGATVAERQLSSGFMVTPRTVGERVLIEVEQQVQTRSASNNEIATERLATQVDTKLGEWVQLGAVNTSQNTQAGQPLGRRHSTASDERSVWLKVDVAD